MLEGGCLCGAVRYRTTVEPLFEAICCCEQCQRATGSGHLPFIGVPSAEIEVQGETRSFTTRTGHRGPVTLHFCPTCGSHVLGAAREVPLITLILAGTLAQPKRYIPSVAIHVEEKCAWDTLPGGISVWHGSFGDIEHRPAGWVPGGNDRDYR